MNVVIKRIIKNEKGTIGELYVNNELFCYTLERPEYILKNKQKLYNQTDVCCIPKGKYSVSPYKKVCILHEVPQRTYILIHSGNKTDETKGCILVGSKYNKRNMTIWNSLTTLKKLFDKTNRKFILTIIDIDTNLIKKKKKMNPLFVLPLAKKVGGLFYESIQSALAIKAYKKAENLSNNLIKKVEDKLNIKIKNEEDIEMAKNQLSAQDIKEITLSCNDTLKTEIMHGEDLTKSSKDEWTTFLVLLIPYIIMGIGLYDIQLAEKMVGMLKILLSIYFFGIAYLITVSSNVGGKALLMAFVNTICEIIKKRFG